MSLPKFRCLKISREEKVGVIELHRPEALNALNDQLMDELTTALASFDSDDTVHVVVLIGSDKAFAAGADIQAMSKWSYMDVFQTNYVTRNWEAIARFRKPIIAAVSGYALGGGCEIAMMCDFIIAADNAKFGQPEIKIGVIPGAGGSQRLTRVIGKAKAMEMCLTGRIMDAREAEQSGLACRVVPLPSLRIEAIATAAQIAAKSVPAAMMVKEAINRAYESTLSEGILFERRLFHSMFSMEDQKEGMAAFLEKRKPQFRNR